MTGLVPVIVAMFMSEVEDLFKEIIGQKQNAKILFSCDIKISKCPIEKLPEFNKELKLLMLKYQITLIEKAGFFAEPPDKPIDQPTPTSA